LLWQVARRDTSAEPRKKTSGLAGNKKEVGREVRMEWEVLQLRLLDDLRTRKLPVLLARELCRRMRAKSLESQPRLDLPRF
jgi:hypothetical protein